MNIRTHRQPDTANATRPCAWQSMVAFGKRARLRFVVACVAAAGGVGASAMPVAAPAAATVGRPEDALRLIEAVRRDRVDAVRQLAGAGGTVDACVPGDGTALIAAARGGDPAMLGALLGLGADPNRACAGDGNPLIAAAADGHIDAMARLLAAGARVDAVVPGDETALITAVRKDQRAAVRYLASHGANLNLGARADNGQWRTPLNQARSEAVAQFLRSLGATPAGAGR